MRLQAYGLSSAVLSMALLGTVEAAAWQPEAVSLQLSQSSDSGLGVGGSVRWALQPQWRIRVDASHYREQQEHLVSLIRFAEQRDRTDLALVVERQLTAGQGWYVAAGIAHPGEGAVWDAEPDLRMAYTLNGRQYAGEHLSEPRGKVAYADAVPYLGLGWRSQPQKHWQFEVELGVLNGLQPEFEIHTANPLQLPYLQADLQAEADRYIENTEADSHLSSDTQLTIRMGLSYRF